jgi:hypothetical protein
MDQDLVRKTFNGGAVVGLHPSQRTSRDFFGNNNIICVSTCDCGRAGALRYFWNARGLLIVAVIAMLNWE